MKERIVATLTSANMLESKKKKMAQVPITKTKTQNKYEDITIGNFKILAVFAIALGDASKLVSVVLNIVVNAAIPIIQYAPFPKLSVYNAMSCCAKSPPTLENRFPVPYITKAPNRTKHTPRTMVVK